MNSASEPLSDVVCWVQRRGERKYGYVYSTEYSMPELWMRMRMWSCGGECGSRLKAERRRCEVRADVSKAD